MSKGTSKRLNKDKTNAAQRSDGTNEWKERREEGSKKGREEGRKEGREEGRQEGRKEGTKSVRCWTSQQKLVYPEQPESSS